MIAIDTRVELLIDAYITQHMKRYRKAESLLPSLGSWDLAQLSDLY